MTRLDLSIQLADLVARDLVADAIRDAAETLHRSADRHPLTSQNPNTPRYRIKAAASALVDALDKALDADDAPAPTRGELAHRYAEHLVNTGGGDLDTLLAGGTDARVNLPVAVLEACVQSQAMLLGRLHAAGLLRPPAVTGPTGI